MQRVLFWVLPLAFLASISTSAFGFVLDGSGHYGLKGETRTSPAFSNKSGYYQAIEQSFNLQLEARGNDRLSMFLDLDLFEDERQAYLGDPVLPYECDPRREDEAGTTFTEDCDDRHQSSMDPGYENYKPQVEKAYVRYAFDYCILEAGRRGRDWGVGILLDSASDPFDVHPTVYDGVTCDVNIQKTQTLGFALGFDKLQETGAPFFDPREYPYPPVSQAEQDAENAVVNSDRGYGATDRGDDLNQYFLSITLDDRKAKAGSVFTKQIGVYFANIVSSDLKEGGANTDIKILDVYTGLYFPDMAIRNELLIINGKSADPAMRRLGGRRYAKNSGNVATNKIQSVAVAGDIEWTMARSGSAVGPQEFNRGDASRHLLFLQYAYAPGDEHSYFKDREQNHPDESGENQRDDIVTATPFHRNYKPAMLLFNGRPEADYLREDGGFDPGRVVNASVLGFGYRYENLRGGNFEFKLIGAQQDQKVPGQVRDYFENLGDADTGYRPPGFYGKTIGYEANLKYSYKIGREAELGLAAAAAAPGDAWQIDKDDKPVNNFLIQTHAAFRF